MAQQSATRPRFWVVGDDQQPQHINEVRQHCPPMDAHQIGSQTGSFAIRRTPYVILSYIICSGIVSRGLWVLPWPETVH